MYVRFLILFHEYLGFRTFGMIIQANLFSLNNNNHFFFPPMQVIQLDVQDLDRYIQYLEDVYFQFDESMEDFEFITRKLETFSFSSTKHRSNDSPMQAGEDSNGTEPELTLDCAPVIRRASPQSPSYSLLQISLCYLSWSSPHLMKQVGILSCSVHDAPHRTCN